MDTKRLTRRGATGECHRGRVRETGPDGAVAPPPLRSRRAAAQSDRPKLAVTGRNTARHPTMISCGTQITSPVPRPLIRIPGSILARARW